MIAYNSIGGDLPPSIILIGAGTLPFVEPFQIVGGLAHMTGEVTRGGGESRDRTLPFVEPCRGGLAHMTVKATRNAPYHSIGGFYWGGWERKLVRPS